MDGQIKEFIIVLYEQLEDAMKPEIIQRQMMAVYAPFAMLAGLQLELFTLLADAPKDAVSLAETLGFKVVKLRPLLYSLVNAELLQEKKGIFSNSPEADHFLVKGKPDYIGDMHELLSDIWHAALQTAESIRQGKPQAKHDYDTMAEQELSAFFRGLHSHAKAAGRHLAETYKFSRFYHLLDAGGGSGGSAIAACELCPKLRATVADLPSIISYTNHFIEEAGMENRINVIGVDLTHEPLSGRYDIALLRNFIQVLGPKAAEKTLQNVGQAMHPGGEIYIVGSVLDDDRRSPQEIVAFNIVFLNIYDEGEAYTEREYRAWLKDAGFGKFERILLPLGYSLIRAIMV
jgi:hypothetical protein